MTFTGTPEASSAATIFEADGCTTCAANAGTGRTIVSKIPMAAPVATSATRTRLPSTMRRIPFRCRKGVARKRATPFDLRRSKRYESTWQREPLVRSAAGTTVKPALLILVVISEKLLMPE